MLQMDTAAPDPRTSGNSGASQDVSSGQQSGSELLPLTCAFLISLNAGKIRPVFLVKIKLDKLPRSIEERINSFRFYHLENMLCPGGWVTPNLSGMSLLSSPFVVGAVVMFLRTQVNDGKKLQPLRVCSSALRPQEPLSQSARIAVTKP